MNSPGNPTPIYEIPVNAPPRDDAFPLHSGLWRSFYDRKFYAAVLHYWRRFWIYYLLLVVVITALPGLALFRITLGAFMQNEMPAILASFPSVQIENGRAILPETVQQPVIINDSEGRPAMVIDTTAGGSLRVNDAPLLFSRDKLIIQDGHETVELLSFSSLQNLTLDASTLQEMTEFYRNWFLPFLIPVGLFVKLVVILIQIALFAGFGFLMARVRGMVIPYRGTWRLAVVAVTPAMLLQIALMPILGDSEALGLILLVALFGYMWFALDSVYKATLENLKR